MNVELFRTIWLDLANNPRYNHVIERSDLFHFAFWCGEKGLPFLTNDLPALGKAIDASFQSPELGVVLPAPFAGTTFLAKAISMSSKGDPTAVDCVRQLTYVFYKLEVPYDPRLIEAFLDNFISVDREVASYNDRIRHVWSRHLFGVRDIQDGYLPLVIKEMRSLIARVLVNTNPFDIVPQHGPGATSDHSPNWSKQREFRFIPGLDAVYPYDRFFFLNASHVSDDFQKLSASLVCEDPKARVCLVPKDSRGPRVISCEPTEYMYIQQGLMRLLYDTIEKHPLTKGQCNFSDQSINRDMARTASITGDMATIDLKDASDRVGLELVRTVFPPDWVECFEACRSKVTVLPDRREVELHKFAPMGSSCCFPVEALIFWSCASAVLRLSNFHKRSVFVYGDDIICDTDVVDVVMNGLSLIGLVVNKQKSYVKGPFRESCGGDYFLGEDVTPIRLRKEVTKIGTGLQSSADFLNELIGKFGYESVHKIVRAVEAELGHVYPRSEVAVSCSLRVPKSASNDVLFVRRYNADFQRIEYRTLSTMQPMRAMTPSDWWEMLRFALRKSVQGKSISPEVYAHPVTETEVSARPGQYAVPNTVRKSWAFEFLG